MIYEYLSFGMDSWSLLTRWLYLFLIIRTIFSDQSESKYPTLNGPDMKKSHTTELFHLVLVQKPGSLRDSIQKEFLSQYPCLIETREDLPALPEISGDLTVLLIDQVLLESEDMAHSIETFSWFTTYKKSTRKPHVYCFRFQGNWWEVSSIEQFGVVTRLNSLELFVKNIALTVLKPIELRKLQAISLSSPHQSAKTWEEYLRTTLEQAVQLLRATSGGIYECNQNATELRVLVDLTRPEHVNRMLKVGEGMAGRLTVNGEPYMIVDNYADSELVAPIYAEERPFGAVLEVPSKNQENPPQIYSVWYVDAPVGHQFTDQDAYLLSWIATSAELKRYDFYYADRLYRLDEEITPLIQDSQKDLEQIRHEIVRQAVRLLKGTAGGLMKYDQGLMEFQLEASTLNRTDQEIRLPSGDFGMFGTVIQEKKPDYITDPSRLSQLNQVFSSAQFKHLFIVPIRAVGEVDRILFVADEKEESRIPKIDLDILRRLASRATNALLAAEFLNQDQRTFQKSRLLLKVANYINDTSRTLPQILNAILTSVTSGYGLGFNRAAVFLFDESSSWLVGHQAIGQLTEKDAEEAWQRTSLQNLDSFEAYIRHVQSQGIQSTQLNQNISQVRYLSTSELQDSISQALNKKDLQKVKPSSLSTSLPGSFYQFFQPTTEVIVAPLLINQNSPGQEVLGIVLADNKFTNSPITKELESWLKTFLTTAALAIQSNLAKNRIRIDLFEGSSQEILNKLLRSIKDQESPDEISIALIDIDHNIGHPYQYLKFPPKIPTYLSCPLRPNGISIKVILTGQPAVIEDLKSYKPEPNKLMIERGLKSALCLPFGVGSKQLGVVWIRYKRKMEFYDRQLNAIQYLVDSAAIAFDKAKQEERLAQFKQLRDFSEELAQKIEDIECLKQTIVEKAQELFCAHSAVLWVFDQQAKEFDYFHSRSVGLGDNWAEFKKREFIPTFKGYTRSILEEGGWYGEPNISRIKNKKPPLPWGFINKLKQMTIRGFQGVAVSTNQEKFGVLYINYKEARIEFSQEEQNIAQIFAKHAALALKNAKDLEHLRITRNVAQKIMESIDWQDPNKNLEQLVNGIWIALNFSSEKNIVTLHEYIQAKENYIISAISRGGESQEPAVRALISKGTLIGQVLNGKEIIISGMPSTKEESIISGTRPEELMKKSEFAQREGIQSCVGVPLRAQHEIVGAIFINHKNPREFSHNELTIRVIKILFRELFF